MHDLKPITALGESNARVVTVGAATLTEVPSLALASVAARLGQEEICRKHLANLLEGPVPAVGQVRLHDPEAAFWTGPDQWMIEAPFETHEDLAAQLVARFAHSASITEQTDAWTAFDLRGDGVEAVLELLCPLNIRKMQSGDATRTTIHHMGCFVIRCEPADWLRILGPRSSAKSLYHAVYTAMVATI